MKSIWCRSVQGESHKATNKVCQDWSFATVESDIAIAIVCDGHGSERYFRSDIGSRLAGETTQAGLLEVAKSLDPAIFANSQFVAVPKESDRTPEFWETHPHPTTPQRRAIEQLLGYIRNGWDVRVREHAFDNPITTEEKNRISEKYINAFHTIKEDEPDTYAPFYGTTLMAYLQTSDFWLAFHIGDGMLITLEKDATNDKLLFKRPIPEDESCFLNRTTSLCDSDSYNEIRYCFGGNDTKPLAVFLCSDGISDAWGSDDALYRYYVRLLKQIKTKDIDDIVIDLPAELAELSRKSSNQDDMSLACLFDEMQYEDLYRLLLKWQIDMTEEQLEQLRVAGTEASPDFQLLKKNWQDANDACEKTETRLTSLRERLHSLKKELDVTHKENETHKGKLSTAKNPAEKNVFAKIATFIESLFSSTRNNCNRIEQEIAHTEKHLQRDRQRAEKAKKEHDYQIRKSDERSARITQLNETLRKLAEESAALNPLPDQDMHTNPQPELTEQVAQIRKRTNSVTNGTSNQENTIAQDETTPPSAATPVTADTQPSFEQKTGNSIAAIPESTQQIETNRIFDRDNFVGD